MVNTTMVKVTLGPIKVAPDKEAQYRYHVVCRQTLVQINEDVPEHISIKAVFSSNVPNSKFFFRHLHGDLNLDEIKNALRLLSVNGETNLMNLIRL